MAIFSDTLFLREYRSSEVSSRLLTGGLTIGIVLTLRFMMLIFAFQLFLISTQPRDLVNAMEKIGLPIDYILMFIIALRFIPTLQIEGQRIHEASWPGALIPVQVSLARSGVLLLSRSRLCPMRCSAPMCSD